MNESQKAITDIFTGEREQREDISSSDDTSNVKNKTNFSRQPSRRLHARTIQNFSLVWFDSSIDEVNDNDYDRAIADLQQVINTVNIFTEIDECINYITNVKEEKIFLILSGKFAETVVKCFQELLQVSVMCIFSGNEIQYEEWAEKWPKVAGVFKDIASICQALKQATKNYDHNFASISFVKKTDGVLNQNLDILDPSFMYTQILKEILLTIDFEREHFEDFIMYCREQFVDNHGELNNVDKIEREYCQHSPIWWYTYNSFLYSMLNRALRFMKVDLITKMGFFVRDLHNHIVVLHAEQYGGQNHWNSFIVYRGQGLSQTDFNQLIMVQGGLLAFNNFLSTSHNFSVSLTFARRTVATSDLVGVLFVMAVDPSVSATHFANVKNVSYYKGEEEILFSMHSVFRIGQMTQIEGNDRLWQVDLTLTDDNDPQLHNLTESMREETAGSTGWHRLGQLMIKVAQFDKAEELYEILLKQTKDEGEKGYLFHMLGLIKTNQGKYAEAVEFYEKSIKIKHKILPPTHSDLAPSYTSIGVVYDKIGEYSKALSYQEKALEICQKTVSPNHFEFPAPSDTSDLMNVTTDDYTRIISSFEKHAEILEKTLPKDDPSLPMFYDYYGSACEKMGKNEKALLFYERALKIRENHLPVNHPSLAASYANHGAVYQKMGDPSTAHTFNQGAFDIAQRSLPASHPDRTRYREKVQNKRLSP